MNQSIDNRRDDDKILDAYLAGDSPFSRRYQEMPAAEVPPELDAKILAASKAPARKSALPRWRTWSAPVALAATVVIAIAVILRGGLEQAAVRAPEMRERALSTSQDVIAPAAPPAAVAPEPASGVDLPAAKSAEADAASRDEQADTRMFRKELTVPITVEQAPAHTPQPAPLDRFANAPAAVTAQKDSRAVQSPPTEIRTTTSQRPQPTAPEARRSEEVVVTGSNVSGNNSDSAAAETVVTGTIVRRHQGAGPHDAIRPAEKSERTLEREAREADPRYWLEYIRDLRQNNDARAADREWKKFVKAYPDYPVPTDDPARPTSK